MFRKLIKYMHGGALICRMLIGKNSAIQKLKRFHKAAI